MDLNGTFVWTILPQTPQETPQVTYDAGGISAWTVPIAEKTRLSR